MFGFNEDVGVSATGCIVANNVVGIEADWRSFTFEVAGFSIPRKMQAWIQIEMYG
jgi:hypothetical protein